MIIYFSANWTINTYYTGLLQTELVGKVNVGLLHSGQTMQDNIDHIVVFLLSVPLLREQLMSYSEKIS